MNEKHFVISNPAHGPFEKMADGDAAGDEVRR